MGEGVGAGGAARRGGISGVARGNGAEKRCTTWDGKLVRGSVASDDGFFHDRALYACMLRRESKSEQGATLMGERVEARELPYEQH